MKKWIEAFLIGLFGTVPMVFIGKYVHVLAALLWPLFLLLVLCIKIEIDD